MLWTRLAPEPLRGGGAGDEPVAVRWEVADDESFARVVRRGSATARPAGAFSVHVEVSRLQPARGYLYRFIAGGEVCPVGRTLTAPAAREHPERLRFGLGSCQHFEQGFYAAHRHLMAEDLDLMVIVGDYIHEGAGRAGDVRRREGGETRTLADYRNRHAQYKTDRDLQAGPSVTFGSRLSASYRRRTSDSNRTQGCPCPRTARVREPLRRRERSAAARSSSLGRWAAPSRSLAGPTNSLLNGA